MENKTIVEILKSQLQLAEIDFKQIQFEDEDSEYVDDDDKCVHGYIVGYTDAIKMLINSFEAQNERDWVRG